MLVVGRFVRFEAMSAILGEFEDHIAHGARQLPHETNRGGSDLHTPLNSEIFLEIFPEIFPETRTEIFYICVLRTI